MIKLISKVIIALIINYIGLSLLGVHPDQLPTWQYYAGLTCLIVGIPFYLKYALILLHYQFKEPK